MTRPNSIIWFERLFLFTIALGMLNTARNWSTMQDRIAATPGAATLPSGLMMGTLVVGIIINLLLWYFIARRGSNVARIILTVLFAIGIFGVIMMFFRPLLIAMMVVPIISYSLQGIAIWMLYRPDAKPWFSPNKESLENIFS